MGIASIPACDKEAKIFYKVEWKGTPKNVQLLTVQLHNVHLQDVQLLDIQLQDVQIIKVDGTLPLFTLIEEYNIYIYCTTRRAPLLLSSLHPLGRGPPLGVPSRDSNSGLPYSKPMRYNLSHTAPEEPHRTLKPHRTLEPKVQFTKRPDYQ